MEVRPFTDRDLGAAAALFEARQARRRAPDLLSPAAARRNEDSSRLRPRRRGRETQLRLGRAVP